MEAGNGVGAMEMEKSRRNQIYRGGRISGQHICRALRDMISKTGISRIIIWMNGGTIY